MLLPCARGWVFGTMLGAGGTHACPEPQGLSVGTATSPGQASGAGAKPRSGSGPAFLQPRGSPLWQDAPRSPARLSARCLPLLPSRPAGCQPRHPCGCSPRPGTLFCALLSPAGRGSSGEPGWGGHPHPHGHERRLHPGGLRGANGGSTEVWAPPPGRGRAVAWIRTPPI